MALESEAAFKARASEIGISDEDIGTKGWWHQQSFTILLHINQVVVGSEDVLFNYLEEVSGTKPPGASASNYRRLFFESHVGHQGSSKSNGEV